MDSCILLVPLPKKQAGVALRKRCISTVLVVKGWQPCELIQLLTQ